MKPADFSLFHQTRKFLTGTFLRIAALVIFFTSPALAAAQNISILSSSNNPLYNKISSTIVQTASEENTESISFQHFYAGNLSTDEIERIKHSDLVVTIGRSAMLSLPQLKTSPPILVSLVPSQSFNANKPAFKNLNNKISGIFIDSPPERQILLAKILLGERQTLAFLQSDKPSFSQAQISKITKKAGLRTHFEKVSNADNIARKLSHALEKSDVLLALPDPVIFNRNTARNILLTTYRRRTPVIGFSANYVRAGALAAAYSTTEQIAQQTGKMIRNLVQPGSRFPYGGHFPAEFEIEVNANVARSLGISLMPKSQIKAELKTLLEKTQ